MSFAGKWMELEIIMLHDERQMLHVFSHLQNLDTNKQIKSHKPKWRSLRGGWWGDRREGASGSDGR
jgi:hypothetical protein